MGLAVLHLAIPSLGREQRFGNQARNIFDRRGAMGINRKIMPTVREHADPQ